MIMLFKQIKKLFIIKKVNMKVFPVSKKKHLKNLDKKKEKFRANQNYKKLSLENFQILKNN